MTETWKPQPGKPAMTRDEKTLVTDLEKSGRASRPWISTAHIDTWRDDGGWNIDGSVSPRDLIEPTAAILAANGIDADGKPVADPPGTFSDGGKYWEPDVPATPVDVAYIPAAKLAEIMELAKRQPYGTPIAIEHDGFKGLVIGWYVRLDGVPGIVAQLDDAKVVHVYGEKWLKPASEVAKREER